MRTRSRTALVSGAAGGIGLAISRRLVADEWRVIATALPSEDTAELELAGVARVAPVDFLDPASVDAFSASLEGEPRWDALVSNAGISVPGPIEGVTTEQLRRQLEVNTVAPMRLARALLPGSGVTVSLIEPGAIRTGILTRSRAAAAEVLDGMPPEAATRYRSGLDAVLARSDSAFAHALAPDELAALVSRVLVAPRPRPRYLFGRDARGLAAIALLPAIVRAKLVARLSRAADSGRRPRQRRG